MKKKSEEEVHLLEDEQQPVFVHIYFDLEDKPKKFMRALQELDVSWDDQVKKLFNCSQYIIMFL